MARPYSRRSFLEASLMAGAALVGRPISHAPVAREAGTNPPARPDFLVADYHVHLSPALSVEEAIALGKQRQVQIGIVEHPGPGFPINTDADLRRYIDGLRRYPSASDCSRCMRAGRKASRKASWTNWTTS